MCVFRRAPRVPFTKPRRLEELADAGPGFGFQPAGSESGSGVDVAAEATMQKRWADRRTAFGAGLPRIVASEDVGVAERRRAVGGRRGRAKRPRGRLGGTERVDRRAIGGVACVVPDRSHGSLGRGGVVVVAEELGRQRIRARCPRVTLRPPMQRRNAPSEVSLNGAAPTTPWNRRGLSFVLWNGDVANS